MDMRIRLPELMTARDWTAYRVAKESGWAINTTTVSRIFNRNGEVDAIKTKVADALMDAFGLENYDELFARDAAPKAKTKAARARTSDQPAVRKAKR